MGNGTHNNINISDISAMPVMLEGGNMAERYGIPTNDARYQQYAQHVSVGEKFESDFSKLDISNTHSMCRLRVILVG